MKIYWKAVIVGLLADIVATIALQTVLLTALIVRDAAHGGVPITAMTAASFMSHATTHWLPAWLLGVAMTILGGFIAGRIAPTHKLLQGSLVGAFGLLLALLTPQSIFSWRFVGTSIAAVLAGLTGGYLAMRLATRASTRASRSPWMPGFPNSEQLAPYDNWSPLGRPPAPVVAELPLASAAGRLFGQAARAAILRRIDWSRVVASPALIALLVLTDTVLSIGIQRLFISGAADFYWRALFGGWIGTAVLVWCCYLLGQRSQRQAIGGPTGAQRFAASYLAAMLVSAFCALGMALPTRSGYYNATRLGTVGMWIVWATPLLWSMAAALRVLVQDSQQRGAARMLCALLLATVWSATFYFAPSDYWSAADEENSESHTRLVLSQETFEAQQHLFANQLAGLKPQRPGVIDLYAITFAPYAEESVFRRESAVVADVMRHRFDTDGRTLQLLNHNQTTTQFAWATPLNLQRAIAHVAATMNRDEDILFIHLTSHGARNGELAASFWPLDVAAVTPVNLKKWLDDAGVRYRVISISACFSGSWIDTLANNDTLVMTAADATHTSYGCGHRSALTFFGRAMYDEQLRNQTLSFEQAHKAARLIIKQREEDAGKDDGYSNPQIKTGAAIRARLGLLEARLRAH